MSIINTNVDVAERAAQPRLPTAPASPPPSQRLSSGLRINSAKDDAAGLAISERFTTQIRGLNQAARNANDGISLAQTAEGALGEIGNNLQRIRELAVQSRNATNSADDRAALQKEVTQLKAEIDRVADQTTFNGTKLLDGSFTNQAFQVGANQGQTIDVAAIADANIDSLGTWTSVGSSTPATASGAVPAGSGGTPATGGTASFDPATLVGVDFSTEQVSFNVTLAGGSAQTITLDAQYADGDALATAINTQLTGATASFAGGTMTITNDTTGTGTGVTVDAFNADADANTTDSSVTALPAVTAADGDATVPGTFGALVGAAFTINGTNIEVGTAADAATRASDLMAAINSANLGVTASVTNGALSLTSADDIVIGGSGAVTEQTGLTAGTQSAVVVPGAAQTGFANLDISNVAGADNAILAMDAALSAVNGARADLGAVQNRFQSVISNLNTTSENLTASRSRIRDADYAKETAELSRTQILSQAGTAMLAQANQATQGVLGLLR